MVHQTVHWKMVRMRFLHWHEVYLISCYSSSLEQFLLPDYSVSWSLPGGRGDTHTVSLLFKWKAEWDLSCLLVTEKGDAVILFLPTADTVQLKHISYPSGSTHPPNVFYGCSSIWAPSLYERKQPHYLLQTHNWNIPLKNASITLCTFCNEIPVP